MCARALCGRQHEGSAITSESIVRADSIRWLRKVQGRTEGMHLCRPVVIA